MQDKTDKFSYKVPENSAVKDAPPEGTKIEKTFEYQVCETVQEAQEVADKKGWTLLGFVNDELKALARASSYQNELALHVPSKVSVDDIKARMVRDFIRLGLAEDVATQQVESILAANNG